MTNRGQIPKDQGNIARWRKKEGDKIEVGDIICEIETDKGSKGVQVGQPIAITVEDPANVEKMKSSVSGNMTAKEATPTPAQHATRDDEAKVQKSIFSRISPSAKILIVEHKLDASSIMASGIHGTLTKSNVLTPIKSVSSEVQESDSYEDFPNTQIHKVWEFDQDHQRWLPVAELADNDNKGDQVFSVAWAPNIGRPFELMAVETSKGILKEGFLLKKLSHFLVITMRCGKWSRT
ncbi:hypothetical protein L2E82_32182 [Cichorium intybus]|uniref:Uncharacterized protein n=1 Tax=Cichorium intybus TaxID=13427 RepID=A0ACB9BG25_CICIN|nr:hypothetical protein L2E82_32182 [Cichorium intybus]